MSDKGPEKPGAGSLEEKLERAGKKLERKFQRAEEKLETVSDALEDKAGQIERSIETAVESLDHKLEEAVGSLDRKLDGLDDLLSGRKRRVEREKRLESVYEGEIAQGDIIVEALGLKKYFPRAGSRGKKRDVVRAVDGVDLRVIRGETLGVVGESGCGKSTAARCLIGLIPPTGGSVSFFGNNVEGGEKRYLRDLRRRTSIIFQDPYGSMDPRMTVAGIVSEPLRAHMPHESRTDHLLRALDAIEACGLQAGDLFKYPHQFSGGQRQRVCIARALIAEPDLVVCDEPVSALDVSIQAQIINLLIDLREARDLTYAFISHDLEVVSYIADRVAVMYLGRVVEMARKEELFSDPRHPYTEMLLESAPVFGRRAGEVDLAEAPELVNEELWTGCRFRNRCPKAKPDCARTDPQLRQISNSHVSACLFT